MAKCAFLGLGVMGAPMAGWLVKAGHDVTVWNRTSSKAQDWCDMHGGRLATTPREAVEGAEFVMMCVGNDQDAKTVFEAAAPGLSEGALFIDHTTTSPTLAQELEAKCNELARDVSFIDAPVSGGQAGAENGQLTIMVGGAEATVSRAVPVMDAYAKRTTRIGEVGAGQGAKCVNQICIAGVVQGLAEGIHFARRSGLDIEKVITAISSGAAQSWQMENRWKTMVEGEYEHGFAVDWMRKDLKIALSETDLNGARLPLTALVDQFYADVQNMGGSRWDTSSLLARFEDPRKKDDDA